MGLYFTLRGYHSLDGDQAYRLPLLLHKLDPSLYAADPFVRAFDTFNPHRGYLLVLGEMTGLVGLAPGLLIVFVLMFLATCRGIDRLARETWPGSDSPVGWVAIILVLTAKAGNIGTNHLFEAMVLDRLMSLALGWLAVVAVVGQPEQGWWPAAIALGLATIIHPSLGLQLALMVMGSWGVWTLVGSRTRVSRALGLKGIMAAGLGVMPGLGLNLAPGGSLLEGLPAQDFWTLAVELQSPQHMLPHLWRMPQWLSWGCYLLLAMMALGRFSTSWIPSRENRCADSPGWPAARVRLALMLALVLVWLGGAWVATEMLQHLRITIFQPLRMATVARGLALVLIAGRLVDLWDQGGWLARVRSVLIGVAMTGDWMLVVVTLAEAGAALAEAIAYRLSWNRIPILSLNNEHIIKLEFYPTERVRRVAILGRTSPALLAFACFMAYGLYFLSRHDTERGHWPILLVLLGGLVVRSVERQGLSCQSLALLGRTSPALRWAMALSWAVPILALVAGMIPADHPVARMSLVHGLVARCRFAAVPIDDIERLALWCREHTPATARFIGPPGPKTFRLWSRRSLAFNRAGSPYHAAGLADWFARFQDHVDVHTPPSLFVRDYLADRHRLEARYDWLSDNQRAALALRQGADHVIAPAPRNRSSGGDSSPSPASPLELLHTEGRYAVYRVRSDLLSQRQR